MKKKGKTEEYIKNIDKAVEQIEKRIKKRRGYVKQKNGTWKIVNYKDGCRYDLETILSFWWV